VSRDGHLQTNEISAKKILQIISQEGRSSQMPQIISQSPAASAAATVRAVGHRPQQMGRRHWNHPLPLIHQMLLPLLLPLLQLLGCFPPPPLARRRCYGGGRGRAPALGAYLAAAA
jgi:hypothetical protein